MKRTFEIEWEDDLGPMWMNVDNLMSCLNTETHCGEAAILSVTDLTKQPEQEQEDG